MTSSLRRGHPDYFQPSSVFIIIPVHNGVEFTLPTVRALLPLLRRGDRLLVVDDGSSDGTADILSREFPEVIILKGDGQLWWSGAINLGARYASEQGASHALFLNNDVILHPQFFEELLIASDQYPDAVISSKILSADQPWRLWCLGGRINWLTGTYAVIGHNQPDDGRYEEPFEADWLPGMSVLVPIPVFRRDVWLDAQAFPQYSGDADFSIRCRQAGHKLIVWPKSRVYNKVRNSGTTTKLLLRTEAFSMRLFWESLTSIKSSAAFCTYGKLILRHAPVWAVPLTLLRFYLYYFAKCLQASLGIPGFRDQLTRKRYASTRLAASPSTAVPQEFVNDFD